MGPRRIPRPIGDRLQVPRTEERILPASRRPGDRLAAEHLARYRFAGRASAGRIRDVGCGTGYGARELARGTAVREIVAIDRSDEAIAWALRYYPDPKVSFRRADVTARGWEADLGRFDAVVAFELIEHLTDESELVTGIRRALSPGGVLWLSTPLGRGRGISASDPFHAHQLRRSEVVEIFRRGWRAEVFGQLGEWIEPWTPGRRYRTILVRARPER